MPKINGHIAEQQVNSNWVCSTKGIL